MLKDGHYHIGKNSYVVNAHTSNKVKETIKALLDDNNKKESDIDSKIVSKPTRSKRSGKRTTKA